MTTVRRILLLFLLLLPAGVVPFPALAAEDAAITTLWPLLDLRSAPEDDYFSLGLAGPLVRYEENGTLHRFSLRPLFSRETDGAGTSESDLLYPVASWQNTPDETHFQFLHLLNVDIEPGASRAELFPLFFYKRLQESETSLALFPLAGRLHDRFGRERIDFFLFPLYSQSERRGIVTTNLLWPVFSLTGGEKGEGFGLWPLYGRTESPGDWRRGFFLWPLYLWSDERLATPDPLRVRASFPLFHYADSPQRSAHSWLWPFFSHIEDYRNDFEEWNAPWPLVRVIDGRDRQMLRLLPFYSRDETAADTTSWYLWPLLKREARQTPTYRYERTRILYFLYSASREALTGDSGAMSERIDLWPLFSFEKKDGISRFATLALLEPFFPGNAQIERNWSPLWRIYQSRRNGAGESAVSFLWNLYWHEARPDALAYEVFPLIRWQDDRRAGTFEVALFKGLYRQTRTNAESCTYLLYLPWGICGSLPRQE